MKLTSVNKLIIISVIGIISACNYKPETTLLMGQWKYVSVEKNNQPLFTLSDEDMMMITDSTFEYHILSVDKHMNGTWSYSNHTLHLDYNVPDTIRHFKVNILSKYDLQIQEGDVVFKFNRVKTD